MNLTGPDDGLVPGRGFFLVVFIVILIAAGYFAVPRFEWHKPTVKITPDSDTVGLGTMEISVTEQGSGLKSFSAVLSSGGTDYPLVNEQYDQPVMQKQFKIVPASKLAGAKEGPAVLRIRAKDRSSWNWFRGNETAIQKNVALDITPPTLELIADDRYVNFGGVGVIVYKPSADTMSTGVKIGNYVFPGYKGQIKEHPDYYLAFFAHPYNVAEDQKAMLFATDKAGNSREMKLLYELKNVKYKKSTIPITDDFIQGKVAPLLNDVGARQGSSKRRLHQGQQRSPQRERRENCRHHAEVHAQAPLARRFYPAQQFKSGGQLRRRENLHLQKRSDRYRLPRRLRSIGNEALPRRSRQQRQSSFSPAISVFTATPLLSTTASVYSPSIRT